MPAEHSPTALKDRILDALRGVTPGVCLRAYQAGRLVHDIRAGQTWPRYDLASLTKVIFTQQAMMQAFDRGQWHLGTTVAEVLPDFPNKRVAIQALLTHSSGIEWWKPFYLAVDLSLPWQQKRVWLYEALKKSEFRQTGTSVYSDLGFMLLGFILEQLSGKNLLALWADTKAGVYPDTSLAFHIENQTLAALDGFAPTEDCVWRKRVLQGQVHDENTFGLGGISTHAGLFGTIDDLSAFGLNLRAQMQGTANPGVRPQTAQLFTRRAVPVETGDWALGFMLPSPQGASCGSRFSPTSVGHTGFTGTSVWFDPQQDLLVAILSNRVFYGRENKAFLQLRPKIHDWVVESL